MHLDFGGVGIRADGLQIDAHETGFPLAHRKTVPEDDSVNRGMNYGK